MNTLVSFIHACDFILAVAKDCFLYASSLIEREPESFSALGSLGLHDTPRGDSSWGMNTKDGIKMAVRIQDARTFLTCTIFRSPLAHLSPPPPPFKFTVLL